MNFSNERFLTVLYELYFTTDDKVLNSHEYADQEGLDHDIVTRAEENLRENGLIESPFIDPSVQITIQGIELVEKKGLAEMTLIHHQQQFRIQYLDILATDRDEHGPNWIVDCRGVLEKRQLAEIDLVRNFAYLLEGRYIESMAIGYVRITPYGHRKVDKWRKKVRMLEQFRALKLGSISPQKRGHELEILIELAAKEEQWGVEKNVLRPGEEIDLILYRDFDYFLVSSKWEKSAIEVSAVRDLRERINHRPTSRGVLLSMSGFSQNAENYARERLESAVILLFGPNDIERVFNGELTSLLVQKLHIVMTKRAMEWK